MHKHEFGTLSFFSARPFIWIIKESKHDNHLKFMFAPDIIQCHLQTWNKVEEGGAPSVGFEGELP